MKELPKSDIYEQEFRYMPWGILIEKILDIIQNTASQHAIVLDIMCGPGYLLGEIKKRRDDLVLEGTDINKEFINFAQHKYPDIQFSIDDALIWNPTKKYDIILCTAGIHHLPYDKQIPFLEKIANTLNPSGFAILADPYIDNYSDEQSRKIAAAKLGYEYIVATTQNGATREIVEASIDILHNDVMGFEYKTSLNQLEPVLRQLFSKVNIHKTWPETHSEYGDYYIIAKV
jgi:trans-aconitate methyltransferase